MFDIAVEFSKATELKPLDKPRNSLPNTFEHFPRSPAGPSFEKTGSYVPQNVQKASNQQHFETYARKEKSNQKNRKSNSSVRIVN